MNFTKLSLKNGLLACFLTQTIWATPQELAPINWYWSGPLLVGAGALQIYSNQQLSKQKHPDTLTQKPSPFVWDRAFKGQYNPTAAHISDGAVSLFALYPIIQGFRWSQGSTSGTQVGRDIELMAEILTLNSALNLWVRKENVWPRPASYNSLAWENKDINPEASGSFYSGHASASFALASFIVARGGLSQNGTRLHTAEPYLWYALATSIAGLRIQAGKHWPTDVIVGALIGSGIGWGLTLLHQNNQNLGVQSSSQGSPTGFVWHTTF